MDNREVHEARCGRNPSASSPQPPAAGAFDPDDEAPTDNVFTPPAAPPAAATTDNQNAPNRPPAPPRQRQPSAWREVDVAAADDRWRRVLARLQALHPQHQQGTLGVQQEQQRSRERPHARSSSSSSGSGLATRGARAAGAADAAGGGAGAGAGGAGGGAPPTWACTACTFLNEPSASRCEICGTWVPPEHRPSDRSYRDTLIGGDAAATQTGAAARRRRRSAGAAEDLEDAAEDARCRLAAGAGGGGSRAVGLTGGGSGGRAASDEDVNDAGPGAMSGAAAGSAIGAFGAGLISATQPGARPSQVLASMIHGAFMGGVAGAAFMGGGVGDDETGARGGGTNPEDPRGHRRRQPSFEYVAGPSGARLRRTTAGEGGADSSVLLLETLMLVRRMEALTLRDAAAAAMREQRMRGVAAGPRRIVLRGVHHHGGDGGAMPASARSIAALPEEWLTADSLAHLKEDGRQCCICLEDFDANKRATRLPCLHLYHTTCIEDWLQKSGTCPQCKRRVD